MRNAGNTQRTFQSTVSSGLKLGRTIGFPTLNLDPSAFPDGEKSGVYACEVQLATKTNHAHSSQNAPTIFKGALYFGPRLVKNESANVLEIFLFDFNKEIYGHTVLVTLHDFIRPPLSFSAYEEMRVQLGKDVERVKLALDRGKS